MATLKTILNKYMYRITCILIVCILFVVLVINIYSEQRRVLDNANRVFAQMEHVLEENNADLDNVIAEYKQTCLNDAIIISKYIADDPGLLTDVEELKNIASLISIDEINIFNSSGVLFAGTNPEYYGMTFDDGEQISFFKPMLYDKELRLVQELIANTASGKLIQYSAVWSENKEFIVQIGIPSTRVLEITEKNELTHIFSLFRVDEEVNYFAIDKETGEIIGCTNLDVLGKKYSEVGLKLHQISNDKNGFHSKVCGEFSFCVFEEIDGNYIGRVLSFDYVYQRVPSNILIIFICLSLVAFILAKAVTNHNNKYVVNVLSSINKKLDRIANGNLDEIIDITSSEEFTELSDYINLMVNSLLDNNKKLSYALSKTNLFIGVYEYDDYATKVRFTEYVPMVLNLDNKMVDELSNNVEAFKKHIEKIMMHPLTDEDGVYIINNNPPRYIKIEQTSLNGKTFGVLIDVTEDVVKRKQIENERDIDQLTGLLNRRGYDIKINKLFKTPEKIGVSAVIMIDADGLKYINDNYGHNIGDIYLNKISEAINVFNPTSSLVARLGGDEYAVFLYGYETEKEIIDDITKLINSRNNELVHLNDNVDVPIQFSIGYSTIKNNDYSKALKEADEKMYIEKAARKKNR